MKRKYSSLVLLCAVLGGVSTRAATLYPNGVTESSGLTLSALQSAGWSTLYDVSYGTPTTLATILAAQTAAGAGSVFVGGFYDDGRLKVGATGLASEVLSQTYQPLYVDSTGTSYPSSNLYWYNVDQGSFGFSPTPNLLLSEADITGVWTPDDGQNALRLSWHNLSFAGGWRAGEVMGLNTDPTGFRKVILFSGGAVPDKASTGGLALTGIAGMMLFIRRKS